MNISSHLGCITANIITSQVNSNPSAWQLRTSVCYHLSVRAHFTIWIPSTRIISNYLYCPEYPVLSLSTFTTLSQTISPLLLLASIFTLQDSPVYLLIYRPDFIYYAKLSCLPEKWVQHFWPLCYAWYKCIY